jgi:hypothetical protein
MQPRQRQPGEQFEKDEEETCLHAAAFYTQEMVIWQLSSEKKALPLLMIKTIN